MPFPDDDELEEGGNCSEPEDDNDLPAIQLAQKPQKHLKKGEVMFYLY